MTELRRDVFAIAFLIILVTVFFSPELLTDRTLVTFRLVNAFPWIAESTPEEREAPSVTSDCALSYYPRRVFATRMMRQGEIPLWNPHQFCGTPFLANYQSGVLYPVNLAIYGIDPPQQMDVYLYVHFLIAAIFTYLLLRRLCVSPGGSVVSALAFTFSGFMSTRYGQPTFVSTAAYIPVLLYFAEGLVRSPDFRRAGYLAAAVAMCILAGFPQLVFLAVYSLVLYVVLRILLLREAPWRRRAIVFGLLIFSIAVAALVSAFQLLPTYELSTYSYRKALSYEMILSSAHHRLAALKYFIPDILGHPLDPEVGVISNGLSKIAGYEGFSQNYVSTMGYVGLLPLLLAIAAVARPGRKMIPYVVLAGLALLVVFGTPLLRLLYGALPGFRFSRIDRLVVIYMLGVSVLAGFGFDQVRHSSRKKAVALIALAFAVFSALLAVWLRGPGAEVIMQATGGYPGIEAFRTYAGPKIAAFLLMSLLGCAFLALAALKPMPYRAFMVIAVCLVLIDLVPFASRFKVSQPAEGIVPESPFVESLPARSGRARIVKYGVDVLPASVPTLLEIDDIHGYNALNVDHYLEVLGAMDSTVIAVENAALRRRIGPLSMREALNSRLLDMLNAAYILSAIQMGDRGVQTIKGNNEGVLPRAYLVGRAQRFGTYGEVLDYMKTEDFDPAGEVVLAGEGMPAGEDVPGGEDVLAIEAGADSNKVAGRVDIAAYGPHEIVMNVEAEGDCYLFISDTYYPGWKAYVDGVRHSILRANYAFRSVEVPGGRHEVTMEFEPDSFRVGIILSIAGLSLLVVSLLSRPRAAVL